MNACLRPTLTTDIGHACPANPSVVDPDIVTIRALDRGFREEARILHGTEFSSWESPLPHLTWSHLPVLTIKRMLDQGGFDWDVKNALDRKAKGEAGEE